MTDQRVSVAVQFDLEQIAAQIVAAVQERLTPDILPPAQMLFSVRDTVAVLGMGQTKIRSLIARGILRTVRVDGMLYVQRESLITLTTQGAEPCRNDLEPTTHLTPMPFSENRKTHGRKVKPR